MPTGNHSIGASGYINEAGIATYHRACQILHSQSEPLMIFNPQMEPRALQLTGVMRRLSSSISGAEYSEVALCGSVAVGTMLLPVSEALVYAHWPEASADGNDAKMCFAFAIGTVIICI